MQTTSHHPTAKGRSRKTPSSSSNAKRAIIRLQLDIPAKQALDQLCEQRGMTQIAALSRMVKWLVGASEIVKLGVLGHGSPELVGDLAQRQLEALVAAGKNGNGQAH